jgi:hypothetical protein
MAALDFPSPATNGQTYSNWIYDSSIPGWTAQPASVSGATASATAPSSPNAGDLWYSTNEGLLYVYYNDGTSSQWVEVKANSYLGSTLSARTDALENGWKNYLLNGAFDIWQRGTSQSTSGYGSADRWYGLAYGTTTLSQETSDLPTGVRYGMKWVTAAASSFVQIHQPLETAMVIPLRGQTVTFSYYAKVAGGFTGNLTAEVLYSNATTDASYSGNTTAVTVTGTPSAPTSWARLTFTFTVPSDALSLRVGVVPTAAQASGATVRLANVQLEVGGAATPFRRAHPSIQAELAACQRYYWRQYSTQAYSTLTTYGTAQSSTVIMADSVFPVPMRVAPTSVDFSSLLGYDGFATTIPVQSVSLNFYNNFSAGVAFTVNSAGLTQARPHVIISNNTTGAYLGFSAEL